MSVGKKGLISQLSPNELRELLKKKGIVVPSGWKKKELSALCGLNCTIQDLQSVVQAKPMKGSSVVKGLKSQLKGRLLEDSVLKIFTKKGYTCEKNVRKTTGVSAEFDLTGYKEVEDLWEKKRMWVFVECKNKAKVIPSDWKKFLGNFNTFKKRNKIADDRIEAYFYTTGLFDPGIRKEVRLYKKNIQLERIKV